MGSILIIDDDILVCAEAELRITKFGHECRYVHSTREAKKELLKNKYNIILLDIHLRGENGLDHVEELSELSPGANIVAYTSESNDQFITQAFDAGVTDYLIKPTPKKQLKQLISKLLSHKGSYESLVDLERNFIVGESSELQNSLKQLSVAAGTNANTLITGETGTGKELFARALHKNSSRADNSYIVVDCTNLPAPLAESLLFGHDKGSFTGANSKKKGMFHQADGGTIFLDEIGDLDLDIQKSLLRVLQEKTFRPLSSSKEVYSDFRIVAATNRDLDAMVKNKQFRQDLYYRLNALSINLPPLKDRKGDIKLLCDFFINNFCEENGVPFKSIDSEVFDTLETYDWPGNVRELLNVLQTAFYRSTSSDTITVYDLPKHLRMCRVYKNAKDTECEHNREQEHLLQNEVGLPFVFSTGELPPIKAVRQQTIELMEQAYLEKLVEASDASVAKACNISGLSRARLYELLQKHRLSLQNS